MGWGSWWELGVNAEVSMGLDPKAVRSEFPSPAVGPP